MLLAELKHGHALPSYFSSDISEDPFPSLCTATFHSLCFLLTVLLFEVAPNHNAEVLSSVPWYGNTVMYHVKKM